MKPVNAHRAPVAVAADTVGVVGVVVVVDTAAAGAVAAVVAVAAAVVAAADMAAAAVATTSPLAHAQQMRFRSAANLRTSAHSCEPF